MILFDIFLNIVSLYNHCSISSLWPLFSRPFQRREAPPPWGQVWPFLTLQFTVDCRSRRTTWNPWKKTMKWKARTFWPFLAFGPAFVFREILSLFISYKKHRNWEIRLSMHWRSMKLFLSPWRINIRMITWLSFKVRNLNCNFTRFFSKMTIFR